MKNQSCSIKNRKIKIIAGKWKGRKISVAPQLSVRPTTSRIRETLFNWLNLIIPNSICLDCFAGSGALGLEALSRGAQKVTCIDHNYFCTTALTQTSRTLQAHNIEIIHSNCCYWLKQTKNTYNVIFIDPPFDHSTIIYKVVLLLEKFDHLEKQSWIYIETPRHQNIFNAYQFPKHWILYRKQITHNIACHLYYRNL